MFAAGVLAIVGSVLVVGAGLLQWRQDIPRGNPLEVLAYVHDRPWFAAAYMAIIGMVCWAVALSTAGRALDDRLGRAVARMVDPVMIVGVAAFVVDYAHDGVTTAVLARQAVGGGLDPAEAEAAYRVVEGLVGGTTMLAHVLVGFGLTGYAVAILLGRQFPAVLAWVGVVSAFGWFASGSALFLQVSGASFELLLPFNGVATIWVAIVGFALLLRARSSRG